MFLIPESDSPIHPLKHTQHIREHMKFIKNSIKNSVSQNNLFFPSHLVSHSVPYLTFIKNQEEIFLAYLIWLYRETSFTLMTMQGPTSGSKNTPHPPPIHFYISLYIFLERERMKDLETWWKNGMLETFWASLYFLSKSFLEQSTFLWICIVIGFIQK